MKENSIHRLWTYVKSRRRVVVPGMTVFIALFAVSVTLNLSISYMGNTNETVTSEIIRKFWLVIILQIIKVLAAYLCIGGFIGGVFYGALAFLKKGKGNGGWTLPFGSAILTLVCALLFFMGSLIQTPQLYIENFSAHAAIFASLQDFAVDHLHPYIFIIPAWILFLLGSAGSIMLIVTRERVHRLTLHLKSFKRKKLAAACILIGIIWIALYESRVFVHEDRSRPNILIIASDALRPDHFSGNGYARDTTPNIDAIMKKSACFRGMMTAVPRTFPSWVSILTSQYPLTHNVRHMFPRTKERNERFITACGPLGERGYTRAVVSDFAGDIFPRIDLGFDRVIAPDMNFNSLVRQIIIEKQTFLLPFVANDFGASVFPEIRDIAKYSQHDYVTDETIALIEEAREQPFFITTFYSVTHFPFAAPYPFYTRYAKKGYAGPYKYYKQIVVDLGKGSAAIHEDTQADRDQVVALYDGCLNLFDREAGRLYRYLEGRGLLDNTIVVIISDHGENLYDRELGMGHGEHVKGYPALEIPCIIHAPGMRVNDMKTFEGPFSSIDIIPTVYALAGISRPETFQGRALLSPNGKAESAASDGVNAYSETGLWFDNNKASPLFFQHMRIDYPDVTGISEIDYDYRREIVIQRRYQNLTNAAKYRAIVSGRYKLIYIPLPGGVRFELYDIIDDPFNDRDLSLMKPAVLETMKKRFYSFVEEKSAGNFIINKGYLLPVFDEPVF
jgi:arylsulfatase A-like enzyme